MWASIGIMAAPKVSYLGVLPPPTLLTVYPPPIPSVRCADIRKEWQKFDDVLVLHTPYIFEIHLGIICIVGGKNRKENMEGLTVQLSTVVVTLLYSTLLDNLPVKGLVLLVS